MQVLSWIWPNVLPKRMEDFRDRFEHHLILKMRDDGVDEAHAYLAEHVVGPDSGWFACTPREAKIAGLHRFAAAGAALRYLSVHPKEAADIVALDIALRRNDTDWFEVLPPDLQQSLGHKLYYGHFFCHVLHQDYVVKTGHDPKAVKARLLELLDQRGALYPAEHNVGHLYKAGEGQAEFYRCCDPTNSLNPGIGKMSKRKNYA
ncbi:MAG: D-lactate dehydrogenase, partial [Pseudomonadota bacterium]